MPLFQANKLLRVKRYSGILIYKNLKYPFAIFSQLYSSIDLINHKACFSNFEIYFLKFWDSKGSELMNIQINPPDFTYSTRFFIASGPNAPYPKLSTQIKVSYGFDFFFEPLLRSISSSFL